MLDEIDINILKRFPALFKGRMLIVSIKSQEDLGKREMKWGGVSPNGKLVKLCVVGDTSADEWQNIGDLTIHDVLK